MRSLALPHFVTEIGYIFVNVPVVQGPHYCILRGEGREEEDKHIPDALDKNPQGRESPQDKFAYLHGLLQVDNVHHHPCDGINL